MIRGELVSETLAFLADASYGFRRGFHPTAVGAEPDLMNACLGDKLRSCTCPGLWVRHIFLRTMAVVSARSATLAHGCSVQSWRPGLHAEARAA